MRIEIDFFLPTPAGSFTLGRLFVGQAIDITSALLGSINDSAVDFAARGVSLADDVRCRPRAVGRRIQLPLIQRGAVPIVGGGQATLLDTLDSIGAAEHVVLWPEATLAAGGPVTHERMVYGLIERDLQINHVTANEVEATAVLYETM